MHLYERSEFDLALEQRDNGIEVRQCGAAYVARGWQLSREILGIVEAALDCGLCCMIQNGHPRTSHRLPDGRGVEYLSFASGQPHRWVFAIDDQCPIDKTRSGVKQTIFHRRFGGAFTEVNIRYKEEWRSPKNLLVERCHFERALEVAARIELHGGASPSGKNA